MRIISRLDHDLTAVILENRPLLMPGGVDEAEDRPAHVRAASGLTPLDNRLAVIQDDAAFIVLLDDSLAPDSVIALPRGAGGVRLFDDERGNKHHKPDFESCITVPDREGPALLLFGSGSTSARETIVLVRRPLTPSPLVTAHEARGLYAALRAERAFSGSEMNIEGAVCDVGRVRLFNRGNGAATDRVQPVNGSVDMELTELLAYLSDVDQAAVPVLHDVACYDLGGIGGCPLGFTDATVMGRALLYTAVAELSPDVTRDGPVLGAAIGVLLGSEARWAPLVHRDGSAFTGKVEGIAPHPAGGTRVVLVLDHDDHTRPSDLAVAELAGPWAL